MLKETIQMPTELTAENGGKSLMIGEFKVEVSYDCQECYGEGCCQCDEVGTFTQEVPVSWPTIKAIYAKAVDHFGKQEKRIELDSKKAIAAMIKNGNCTV